MCTITTQREPIITDSDIVCYKFVEHIIKRKKSYFYAIFQFYKYKINKVDKAEISFDNKPENQFRAYDDKDFNNFYVQDSFHIENGIGMNIVKPEYVGRIIAVKTGFHSALKADRLTENIHKQDTVKVKCIIPKGSLVYYGETDLIVSNQIIVTDEIV